MTSCRLRLDASFTVDKRAPAHLYKLTYTFSDRQYESAKTISVANKPYVVAVTTSDMGVPQFMNFSITATAGTADLQLTNSQPLKFPTEIYVVGQASTTLISIDQINANLHTSFTSTGDLLTLDIFGQPVPGEFQLIPYNNLVYMIRAVSNNVALGLVGGLGTVSGLLIDTFVPASQRQPGARAGRATQAERVAVLRRELHADDDGRHARQSRLRRASPARRSSSRRSSSRSPELDASTGFVADISNFLGQQFWTFIYPEIVARAGDTVNGVTWDHDVNIDAEGKPVLSLQKLHFVYDPQVVLFTPNDLTHKYALQPKQQVLALTNGQIQEGICWRSANVQPQRLPPTNICAQQILPSGDGMDRPNIIYSSHNRPVMTSVSDEYMGMSVNSFLSVSGRVYNIEESALQNDQTGTSFISQVSSMTNMVVGVLFDYDNDDLGTFGTFDDSDTTKGVVFLNGYLSAAGYTFSSPDHFDVNDVLPSQVPLLEQIADTMGFDVAFFNTDVSLPRQFWSLTYDTFTAPGVPDFIPNVPPSIVDPTFTNRTRSLILSLQNPVHPAAARDDGHLQLRRLGEPAPRERRHRLGVPEQEGRSRCRIDRDESVGPNDVPAVRAADQIRLLHLLARSLLDAQGRELRADRSGLRDVPRRRRHGNGHEGREVLHRFGRQLLRAVHVRAVLAERRRHRDIELHAARHARRGRTTWPRRRSFRRRRTT